MKMLFAGNIRFFWGYWILVRGERISKFASFTRSLISKDCSKERREMVAASSLCSPRWPLREVKETPYREKGLCESNS